MRRNKFVIIGILAISIPVILIGVLFPFLSPFTSQEEKMSKLIFSMGIVVMMLGLLYMVHFMIFELFQNGEKVLKDRPILTTLSMLVGPISAIYVIMIYYLL